MTEKTEKTTTKGAGGEKGEPFAHTRMTLGEHLDELRSRLIKGLVAVMLCFAVAWYFGDELQEIVSRPYRQAMEWLEEDWVAQARVLLEEHAGEEEWPRERFFVTGEPEDDRLRGLDIRMKSIGVGEPFLFKLKICLYFALFFGAPILLWQMWQFVGAGLYKKERRAVLKYFPVSVLMFVAGILFGYFFMVPYGMYFLNRDASIELLLPEITVNYFLTFLRSLCLAFGVIFQLPLLMTFLGGAGIVPPALMSKYRGHFVVGAFVIAAMITPPDPITQLMMGIPLIVLYEFGIWGARIAARKKKSTALVPAPEGEQGA